MTRRLSDEWRERADVCRRVACAAECPESDAVLLESQAEMLMQLAEIYDEQHPPGGEPDVEQLRREVERKANDERAVTWYSQGPGGEFDLHTKAEDARAAAESMLEHYEDRAADDGWPEDIGDLEWGRLVPCEVAKIEERPAPEGSGFDAHWDVTLVRANRQENHRELLLRAANTLRAVVHSSVGSRELLDLAEQLEHAMGDPEPRG